LALELQLQPTAHTVVSPQCWASTGATAKGALRRCVGQNGGGGSGHERICYVRAGPV